MTNQPNAGELLVGSYLRMVQNCELVMYNQRSRIQENQLEIDVIGVDVANGTQQVYICEVATHLDGLRYGTIDDSIVRLRKKFSRNLDYIQRVFDTADSYSFQFWSPVVTIGVENRMTELEELFDDYERAEFEPVINSDYSEKMSDLQVKAGQKTKQEGELGFRILQILEHMR